MMAKKAKNNIPPLMKNDPKPVSPSKKNSMPSAGTGMKVCPKCKGKGLVSCNHM